MPIAIAQIRRAAVALVAEQEPVDVRGLAKRLGKNSKEVLLYLKGISGLSEEIGYHEESTEEMLTRVVSVLRKNGSVVTVIALAAHLKREVPTVRALLRRYPQVVAELGILTRRQALNTEKQVRYTNAARALREAGHVVDVSSLAAYCGLKYEQVYWHVRGMPDFFAPLFAGNSLENA